MTDGQVVAYFIIIPVLFGFLLIGGLWERHRSHQPTRTWVNDVVRLDLARDGLRRLSIDSREHPEPYRLGRYGSIDQLPVDEVSHSPIA